MKFIDDDFLERFPVAPVMVFFLLIIFSLLMIGKPFFAIDTLGWGNAEKIYYGTRELIHPTLLNCLGVFSILFLLFLVGRLKTKDIGLSLKNIPEGLAVFAICWAAIQILATLSCLVTGMPLRINLDWHSPLRQIGRFLTFLLGVGVVEEFQYRAFLFPQIYSRLKKRGTWNRKKTIFIAILISQTIFGFSHLYTNLIQGNFNGNILMIVLFCLALGLVGCFFVFLYLRSGNFFVAVALHGLIDCPFAIMKTPMPPEAFAFLAATLVFFFWPFAKKA